MQFEKVVEIISTFSIFFHDNRLLSLNFLYSVIRSDIPLQQFKAIQEINEYIDKKGNISQWLLTRDILNILLETQDKVLYRQLEKIVFYLAGELIPAHVSLMLASISTPEAYKIITGMLCTTSEKLSAELISYIFSKFDSKNPLQVQFAQEFTLKVIDHSDFPLENYPLEYFKSLLSENHHDFHHIAIVSLVSIYTHFAFHSKVDKDLRNFIKEIMKNNRVVQNINLMLSLHENGMRVRNLLSQKHVEKIITSLKLSDFQNYSIEEHVQSRLDFIELLLKTNKILSIPEFKLLWLTLASSPIEKIFFNWVEKCLIYFSPDFTIRVFDEFFQGQSFFAEMTVHAFQCFYKMFLIINSYERFIELKQGVFQIRLQKQIVNLVAIIEIALMANEEIFCECAKVLVLVNTRLANSLLERKKEIWDEFFEMVGQRCQRNYLRCLKLILSFVETPCYELGYCRLLLFKHEDERRYNSFYVREQESIREVKRKIAAVYGKRLNDIVLQLDGVYFDRFDDNLNVKLLNSFKLNVSFEETIDLGIDTYLSESSYIQNWLIFALSQNENYSELALKVLTSIQTNYNNTKSIRELELPLDQIIEKSFYSFIYFARVIEKLVIDLVWLKKFFTMGGKEYIIKGYCNYRSKDFEFNKVLIGLIKVLIKKDRNYESLALVERVFESIKDIALCESDKIAGVLKDAIEIIKGNKELVRNTIKGYMNYSEFLENCLVSCKDTKFVNTIIGVINGFCENCKVVHDFTIEKLLVIVEKTTEDQYTHNMLFSLLSFLLWNSEFAHIHFEKLHKKLLEILQSRNKGMIAGLLQCINSVSQEIPLDFCIYLLENFLFCKTTELSLPIVKVTFQILQNISKSSKTSQIPIFSYISSKIPIISKKLPISEWNLPFTHISIHKVSFKHIRTTTEKIPYLSVLLHQFFFINSFSNKILEFSSIKPESLLHLIQHLFKKLNSSQKNSVSSNRLFRFFDSNKNFFTVDYSNPVCFVKDFMRVIQEEFRENAGCVFEGKFRKEYTVGSKVCRHITGNSTKFMYLVGKLQVRDIGERFEELIDAQDIKESLTCKKCGIVTGKNTVEVYPQILAIMLQRFIPDGLDNFIKNDEYCEFPMQLVIDIKKHSSVMYDLIGITVHKRVEQNDFYCTYAKNGPDWVKITKKAAEIIPSEKIKKRFFGIKNAEKNLHKSNAFLLFYEKTSNFIPESLENSIILPFPSVFVTSEFCDFSEEILKLQSYEGLKMVISYFLQVLIRTNNIEKMIILIQTILAELRKDPRCSEWVLSLIRNDSVQSEWFLDCPDRLKSSFIVEVLNHAINSSRPSANLRLLNDLLTKPDYPDTLSEIIYIICKANPILAFEENTPEKIISHIKNKINKRDFPIKSDIDDFSGFTMATLTLFADLLSPEQKAVMLSNEISNLLVSKCRSQFIAEETGKFYLALTLESRFDFFVYLDILLSFTEFLNENSVKSLFFQVTFFLQTLQNCELIGDLIEKLFKIEEKTNSLCYTYILIESITEAVRTNHMVKVWVSAKPKLINYMWKRLLNKSLQAAFAKLPESQYEKISEVVKNLKKKNYIQTFPPPSNFLSNKPTLPIPVLLHLHSSAIFKSTSQYKLFDYLSDSKIPK